MYDSLHQALSCCWGQEFLKLLPAELCRATGATAALLMRLDVTEAERRLQVISASVRGAEGASFVRQIQGSPCGATLEQGSLCLFSSMRDDYASDSLMKMWGRKGYLSVRLELQGQPIGVLALFFNEALLAMDQCVGLLERLAPRVGAEIRQDLVGLQKQKEEKLEQQLLLAGIIHEIRNPLASIKGYTELLLLKDPHAEKRKESLRIIHSNCQVMMQLLNDLLDFHQDAREIKVESQSFSLEDLIAHIVEIWHLRAQEKGLDFRLETRGRLPRLITGDALRIKQILVNLVHNAIRFTRTGCITLSLEAEALGVDKARLRFAVKDSGPGMQPEMVQALRKGLAEFHEAAAKVYGGNGLGLYLCRRLAELMGGEIDIRSAPGQGSTFTLKLSCGAAKQEWIEAGEFGSHELARTMTDSPILLSTVRRLKGRILVIDDDSITLTISRQLFARLGLQVETLLEAPLALKRIEEGEKFDLVILDLNMPGMDGFTAARLLKKIAPDLPIIAVTGDAHLSDRALNPETGCDAFTTKPYNWDRIAKLLESFLPPQ
ncbi:MAG: Autoinducer 2 sensor kinase/phosphatase LuxQ [Verrucomicrobiota bacterium]|jgi:signal transduction histidine kinase